MKRKRQKSYEQIQIEKLYRKERRRIQQIIYRGKKQGYIFPDELLPKRPKKITEKSVRKLEKIKSTDLYKKAEFVYKDTGEIVPALERKKEVKTLAIEKAKQTKAIKKYGYKQPELDYGYYEFENKYPTITIIDRIKDKIINLERQAGSRPLPIAERKQGLLTIFEDTINANADNPQALEDYLLQNENRINELLETIIIDSGGNDPIDNPVQQAFGELGALLNQGALSPSQAESLSLMNEFM